MNPTPSLSNTWNAFRASSCDGHLSPSDGTWCDMMSCNCFRLIVLLGVLSGALLISWTREWFDSTFTPMDLCVCVCEWVCVHICVCVCEYVFTYVCVCLWRGGEKCVCSVRYVKMMAPWVCVLTSGMVEWQIFQWTFPALRQKTLERLHGILLKGQHWYSFSIDSCC